MNHLISLILAFLLSLMLLTPAWSQRDCADKQDCFIQAAQAGEAANCTFQDDQFFIPASGVVQQTWTYLPTENAFTIEYANNTASEGIIKHGVRMGNRRGRSNEVRVQFDVLREQLGQVPAMIKCPCDTEASYLDYLRAWSLGSYSIFDLERLQCTWFLQKDQEEIESLPPTIAPNSKANLITVNVKNEARLAPLGKGYYPAGTSVIVELDLEGVNPIDVNSDQSTIDYFRAGDQSLLTEKVVETDIARLDHLELYKVDEAAIEKPQTHRYFQLVKNDSIHQVRVNVPEVPAANNKHISLAGKLAFDFPAEELKKLSRNILVADLPYKQWFAPGFYLQFIKDKDTDQLLLQVADRKWSILERIQITAGDKEWEFTPETLRSHHSLDTAAEELQVTIYYRERVVRYVPFEFAVGMDL